MIIITNLEHDSLLALSLLKLFSLKNKIKIDGICVVEEDTKWESIKKANKWLPLIGLTNIKRYDYDLKINHDITFPKWVKTIISTKTHYTVINLASFHVLASIDSTILERINLVTYGGHNLLSLITNNDATLLKKFIHFDVNTCTIFDTNYISCDFANSVVNQYLNHPFYLYCISLNTNMAKVLTESIYSWNAHQLYYSLNRLRSRLIDSIEVQDVYDRSITCSNVSILKNLDDRDAYYVLSIYDNPFQLTLRNTLVMFYLEEDFIMSVDFVNIDITDNKLKTNLDNNSSVALIKFIDIMNIHERINNYF